MTQKKLIRTSTLLSPEQLQVVSDMAEQRQVSIAAIIRDAVREYLTTDAARRGQPEAVAA